jgi:hypothetical protein
MIAGWKMVLERYGLSGTLIQSRHLRVSRNIKDISQYKNDFVIDSL